MMRRIERENTGLLKAGQDLVIAGYAGLAGTAGIIREKRAELENRFSGDYLDLILNCDSDCESRMRECDRDFWRQSGAAEWEAAGQGGILAALWNLSGAYQTGISFSLRRIPIRQGTIEICEYFELNPYRLYSHGCYVLTADNGGQLAETLGGAGIYAKVIGRVNQGITREMWGAGGCGYLERPRPDELGKIVPDYIFI